ncbi:hypothetical protein ACFOZ5_11255 [Marinobacter lacisalsi]|uniref:Uncharacterized protein n=1 Tax=Marinobacter lacisalsi TaxID=475979 RepID=A0ABV8QJ69_9GAMM
MSLLREAYWTIKTCDRLIVLVASGLAGSFLYFALLTSIKGKSLAATRANWFCCTVCSAFLLAISASVVAHWFGARPSLWLSVAIWPIFFLPLQAGYSIALKPEVQASPSTLDEENRS